MYCHKTHPRIYCRLKRPPQTNITRPTCNSTRVNNVIHLKVPSDLDSNLNFLDRDIWGLGHSPINIHYLKNIPVKILQPLCLMGFKKGFKGLRIPLLQTNLKSAVYHKLQLLNIIQKEVKRGQNCLQV